MSDQNYRKPLLLALAGAVALTAAFYTFKQYSRPPQAEPDQAPSLHRSNAIRRRRPRRNWRHGYEQLLDYDPTERAIENLRQRNLESQGYGEYRNSVLLPTPEDRQGVDLTLVPGHLDSIYNYVVQHCQPPLSEPQQACLRVHIHAIFIQNFVKEEFAEGFIIGEDDADTIATAMDSLDVDWRIVKKVTKAFNQGEFKIAEDYNPRAATEDGTRANPISTDGVMETTGLAPQEALQALAELDHDDDGSDSDISFDHNEDDPGGSQNMLDLLYHIAGEQARREGYIHRGVECNSCGVHPIQGIRYHCANCFDFDLCESCEASSSHAKSHVFYKVRVPAPSRGNIKQVVPKWYPGNPDAFLTSLPSNVSKPLLEETGMERTEMNALYDQFKCIAGHYYAEDPTGLGVAIDRKGFDAYFYPTNGDKPSPSNLIYDRIFAFYDTDRNGLITFDEYIRGLTCLQDKSRYARLKRIFEGYDLDGDGYVNRKDFLRMFRAYYALSKELSREMINTQGDYGYNEEELREVVQGSQPISAAFGGGTLYGHESRTGQDKQLQLNGDLELVNGSNGVLQHDTDMRGDRARAIGNAALRDRARMHQPRLFRQDIPEDEPLMMVPTYGDGDYLASSVEPEDLREEDFTGPDAPLQAYSWPPLIPPEPEDIISALGQLVPQEDITDSIDRTRVLYAQSQRLNAQGDRADEVTRERAVEERWRRRQFYLDEEEGLTKPPGYTEPDSSDDEHDAGEVKGETRNGGSPRRASMASRSSSKVRFDDSAIDTDFETRSNTSSRSVPLNERWGGYELSQAEADIGKDILYQAVQQGFNQLLDGLFKDREDAFMEALATLNQRHQFKKEREEFEKMLSEMGHLETILQDDSTEATKPTEEQHVEQEVERPVSASNSDEPESNAVPTATRGSDEQDAEDHIGLMFGSHAHAESGTSKQPSEQGGDTEQPYRDPTLPQFRPDEAESSTQSATEDSDDVSDSLHDEQRSRSQDAATRVNPFAVDSVDARMTYSLWMQHDLIETQAKHRGGPGRLSFEEFRERMVPEEVSKAEREKKKKKKGKDENMAPEAWESSHDMGKLAFVGTWLEMASF